MSSLTVEQVADLVQVHPNTVKNEIKRGHLEAWRAGNKLRIEKPALEAWKERKRVGETEKVSRLRALEGGGRK